MTGRKRTKPEDMTPEQLKRSQAQKDARARKAARRHDHDDEQHEHDFGDKVHSHTPEGVPIFEAGETASKAETLSSGNADTSMAVPSSETPYPSVSVSETVTPTTIPHEHDGVSHTHLEGHRLHAHNAMGNPVFLDKSDAEKETEHSSAIEEARRADTEASVPIPEIPMPDPNAEGVTVLTVLEDGYTVLGKTWYRGEEIRVAPNEPLAFDSKGQAFYDIDDAEQIRRYGRVMFARGPARNYFRPPEEEAPISMDELNSRGRSKREQRTAGPPGRELAKTGG